MDSPNLQNDLSLEVDYSLRFYGPGLEVKVTRSWKDKTLDIANKIEPLVMVFKLHKTHSEFGVSRSKVKVTGDLKDEICLTEYLKNPVRNFTN